MRCFVAIELPDDVRREIASLAIPPGIRRTPGANLHLTLRFLGEISEEQAHAVAAVLPAVARRPRFAVALDHVGAFPRVVWLGPSAPDPRLDALARDVDSAVTALGLPSDPKPFVAHVTIARPRGPARIGVQPFRAVLPVDALTLFHSSAGRYGPLVRAPLDPHVPADDTGGGPISLE
jgi:RNA 2',3'-cyclic 3'-phosphodiesterase